VTKQLGSNSWQYLTLMANMLGEAGHSYIVFLIEMDDGTVGKGIRILLDCCWEANKSIEERNSQGRLYIDITIVVQRATRPAACSSHE